MELPPWSLLAPKLFWLALPAAATTIVVWRLGRTWWRQHPSARWLLPAVAIVLGLAAGNWGAGVSPWGIWLHAPLLPWWSSEPGWEAIFPAVVFATLASACLAWVGRQWSWGWRSHALMLPQFAAAAWITSSNDRVLRSWLEAAGVQRLFSPESGGLWWMTMLAIAGFAGISSGFLQRSWRPLMGAADGISVAVCWVLPTSLLILLSRSARFTDAALLLASVWIGQSVGYWLVRDKAAEDARLKLLTMPADSFSWEVHHAQNAAAAELEWLHGPSLMLIALLVSAGQNSFSQVPLGAYELMFFAPFPVLVLWLLLAWVPVGPRRWLASALLAALPVIAVLWALTRESLEFGEQW